MPHRPARPNPNAAGADNRRLLGGAGVWIALMLGGPTLAAPIDPAPVVATERAFAEEGLRFGIKQSFLDYAAPDGIVFAPDPVNARQRFSARKDDKGDPALVWWPLWAGIARSGDVGFTTGPYTYGGQPGGYYFTVWKKQRDGAWKWVLDAGPDSDMTGAVPQGSAPSYLVLSTAKGSNSRGAWRDVRRAETGLARAAAKAVFGAYLAVLAPEARVVGSHAAPVDNRAGQIAELERRAYRIKFAPLGGGVSKAGDLAWTYGDARWTDHAKPVRGHYVRIWQLRSRGWSLVFDELLPVSPIMG